MISSIHSIFNNKKTDFDYVEEEGESVSQKDITKVDAELIRELEELFNEDYEEEEDLI